MWTYFAFQPKSSSSSSSWESFLQVFFCVLLYFILSLAVNLNFRNYSCREPVGVSVDSRAARKFEDGELFFLLYLHDLGCRSSNFGNLIRLEIEIFFSFFDVSRTPSRYELRFDGKRKSLDLEFQTVFISRKLHAHPKTSNTQYFSHGLQRLGFHHALRLIKISRHLSALF